MPRKRWIMKGICNKCKEEAEFTKECEKERKVGNLLEQYLVCPNCGEEFHVSYMDKECIDIKNRMKHLRKRLIKEQIRLCERMAKVNRKEDK